MRVPRAVSLILLTAAAAQAAVRTQRMPATEPAVPRYAVSIHDLSLTEPLAAFSKQTGLDVSVEPRIAARPFGPTLVYDLDFWDLDRDAALKTLARTLSMAVVEPFADRAVRLAPNYIGLDRPHREKAVVEVVGVSRSQIIPRRPGEYDTAGVTLRVWGGTQPVDGPVHVSVDEAKDAKGADLRISDDATTFDGQGLGRPPSADVRVRLRLPATRPYRIATLRGTATMQRPKTVLRLTADNLTAGPQDGELAGARFHLDPFTRAGPALLTINREKMKAATWATLRPAFEQFARDAVLTGSGGERMRLVRQGGTFDDDLVSMRLSAHRRSPRPLPPSDDPPRHPAGRAAVVAAVGRDGRNRRRDDSVHVPRPGAAMTTPRRFRPPFAGVMAAILAIGGVVRADLPTTRPTPLRIDVQADNPADASARLQQQLGLPFRVQAKDGLHYAAEAKPYAAAFVDLLAKAKLTISDAPGDLALVPGTPLLTVKIGDTAVLVINRLSVGVRQAVGDGSLADAGTHCLLQGLLVVDPALGIIGVSPAAWPDTVEADGLPQRQRINPPDEYVTLFNTLNPIPGELRVGIDISTSAPVRRLTRYHGWLRCWQVVETADVTLSANDLELGKAVTGENVSADVVVNGANTGPTGLTVTLSGPAMRRYANDQWQSAADRFVHALDASGNPLPTVSFVGQTNAVSATMTVQMHPTGDAGPFFKALAGVAVRVPTKVRLVEVPLEIKDMDLPTP